LYAAHMERAARPSLCPATGALQGGAGRARGSLVRDRGRTTQRPEHLAHMLEDAIAHQAVEIVTTGSVAPGMHDADQVSGVVVGRLPRVVRRMSAATPGRRVLRKRAAVRSRSPHSRLRTTSGVSVGSAGNRPRLEKCQCSVARTWGSSSTTTTKGGTGTTCTFCRALIVRCGHAAGLTGHFSGVRGMEGRIRSGAPFGAYHAASRSSLLLYNHSQP
jgi:hypothetical protein